ncbi:hypothetical protein [Streptomyces sp. CAI-85]|uniref:hypothetical protein n=1 Tax=Streptomyces sp. CAI-85 TaxID=1472662 RepID=UPI0015873B08|nr:hypothetical protein [Streptomyces sp. CAI-85]NUV64994.1 hypothetical protein [Streptomyces sp. CAI-85]
MSRHLAARVLLLERRRAEAVRLGTEILTLLREQRQDAADGVNPGWEQLLRELTTIITTARETAR